MRQDQRRFYGLDHALERSGVGTLEMDPERFEKLSPAQQEAWLFIARNKLQPGDMHPTKKGWYLTDRIGHDEIPLWYKPPSLISIWIRRVLLGFVGLFILMAAIGVAIENFSSPPQ